MEPEERAERARQSFAYWAGIYADGIAGQSKRVRRWETAGRRLLKVPVERDEFCVDDETAVRMMEETETEIA